MSAAAPAAPALASIWLRRTYAALAATDTWLAGSESPDAHRMRKVTKPLLMPLLVGALLTDPDARRSPARESVAAALTAGWGGDIALLRSGTPAFAAGAGSFGVGHVLYLRTFRRFGRRGLLSTPTGKTIAGLWLLTAPALSAAAWRTERPLGPAVAGYSALLCSMAAAAAAIDPEQDAHARRDLLVGGLLFVVSDTLLGGFKFGPALLPALDEGASDESPAPAPRAEFPPARAESLVMATYAAAQYLLARGASRLRTG